MSQRIKVVHLIAGLDTGGAEMMLYRLLTATDRARFEHTVVSLLDRGALGPHIEALGVPVHAIGMRRTPLSAPRLIPLYRLLRRQRPDVLHGWMYHANAVAALLAPWLAGCKVIWGLHHTTIDPRQDKRRTIRIAKLGARLAAKVDQIVSCSESTHRLHLALGYPPEKMVVIPNGFDSKVFAPDRKALVYVRQIMGLPEGVFLIGLVARFHPQKDHYNFLQAARCLLDLDPPAPVHFMLCGQDVTLHNVHLKEWVSALALQRHVHPLGLRHDVPRLIAGLDILTSSSSHGDAFPLVIGEAMASGVPCVVTDVGDSAVMVGLTGKVVPPKSPAALAQAWLEMLKLTEDERRLLGQAARQRILQRFSLSTVTAQYESVYEQAMQEGERPDEQEAL